MVESTFILWDTRRNMAVKITASVTPNNTLFGPLLYPGDIQQAVSKLSFYGYDGIELSLRTPDDIDIKAMETMLKKNSMELLSIATGQSYVDDGLYLFTLDTTDRVEVIHRIKKYIEIISPFGGCVILGGIKGRMNEDENSEQYIIGCDVIDECIEFAERKGVVLLLEPINRYETNFFNTVRSCNEFAEHRNSRSLKILPDTFHMNIEEVSMLQSLDDAAEQIGAIHCADSNRLAPGMGHIDFKSVMQHVGIYPNLKYIGVEVLPFPSSDECARTAIGTLKNCLG